MSNEQPCKKCGLVYVSKAQDTFPYCDVCFWTIHKWYKRAIEILKNPLVPYYGPVRIKEDGYKELEKMQLILLLAAVLNSGSLNKTPKVPQAMTKDGRYKLLCSYFPQFWVNKFLEKNNA